MSPIEVPLMACRSVSDVFTTAREVIAGHHHPLLLFDTSSKSLHEPFSTGLISSVVEPEYVLWIDGRNIRQSTEVYDLIKRAARSGRPMGSNLNALEEVLRDDAVSNNKSSRTYWVYTHFDRLYESDRPFTVELIQMMLSAARQLGEGYFAFKGGYVPAERPVSVLLTGSWEVMHGEAASENSFLYRFPDSYERGFPDLLTNLKAVHITR